MEAKILDTVGYILEKCGSLTQDDRVCLIFDASTENIASYFQDCLKCRNIEFSSVVVPEQLNHGQEPPMSVALEMLDSTLIICLTKYSMAHTNARRNATNRFSRFLSLPYYDHELLDDPAVRVDYKSQAPQVRYLADYLTNGNKAEVKSNLGTSLVMDISGRIGNYCPGFVEKPGELGSPPDIEANVSPLEGGSNGMIAVDGSITCDELGLLETPVFLTVEKGKVIGIESANGNYVEILEKLLGPINSKRRVVAELGIGVNPLAKLTGKMLTDEGAYGFVHFGLGSNSTVGGLNDAGFHLDFVISKASLWVDGHQLISLGEFLP